jgi:folate-binding protein YgfZ
MPKSLIWQGAILGSVLSTTVPSSEYRTVIQACGLVDRSERGKLALSGVGAKEFLQGQVSNDIEALEAGHGCYAAFLTQKGKMLGDLRVLDAGDELLLDTERVSLQALFNMIRRFSLGYDVELHKRTLERGLLSLIGPDAEAVADVPALGEREHSHVRFALDGIDVRAIRADAGVDLLCDSAETGALRAALQQRGAVPVADETAEILRVERGRPRYGLELDDTVIPEEAGLNERAVSFTKGCYVGQETVARLHYRGKPNRHLRGLKLSAPAAYSAEIVSDERVVGRLATTVVSPRLGPIALALVRREAPPGTVVAVGEQAEPATVVELPF